MYEGEGKSCVEAPCCARGWVARWRDTILRGRDPFRGHTLARWAFNAVQILHSLYASMGSLPWTTFHTIHRTETLLARILDTLSKLPPRKRKAITIAPMVHAVSRRVNERRNRDILAACSIDRVEPVQARGHRRSGKVRTTILLGDCAAEPLSSQAPCQTLSRRTARDFVCADHGCSRCTRVYSDAHIGEGARDTHDYRSMCGSGCTCVGPLCDQSSTNAFIEHIVMLRKRSDNIDAGHGPIVSTSLTSQHDCTQRRNTHISHDWMDGMRTRAESDASCGPIVSRSPFAE